MYEISPKEVGKKIRQSRNLLNMDQKEFADNIDTTVSSLSNWENGRNYPKEIYLKNICDLTGYPMSFFVTNTKDRVTNLVESLENNVKIDYRFKHLYNLDFKYNLIKEMTSLVENTRSLKHKDDLTGYNSLNFYDDGTLLNVITQKIYDYDQSFRYTPFDDKKALYFSADQLNKTRIEISRMLYDTDVSEIVKKRIDEIIFNATHEIENLPDNKND